ncbi:MAG: galactitol-1-phosphate 5-dehydrogenase [Candidatus Hydrogenedentes bacterium]|nr:galactitol-1-phosphate 5-dehydrogenase [Candidatus Hydrogenedentota bacterium]
MKACVLHGVGDLRYEDVPPPEPGPGEILLAVGACGVCGSDLPRVFVKGTYRFPTIPGHEFAGRVADVGKGVDPALIGRAFAVFPLIPCGRCPMCRVGEYAQCADYDYLGSRSNGAFAEYVCAPAWNLVAVPDGLSLEEAAMAEPAAVAVHALSRGGADAGDAVLIFGAGPIGLMIAMWARIRGAGKVLLVDIDPRKLDFAGTLGFAHRFNSKEGGLDAWIRTETGRGADLVVEASGSSAAFAQCMPAARTFGRVVLMGNPAGEMRLPQDAYWAILRKQLTVTGTWNSRFSDLPRNEWALALDTMASGALNVKPLITHRVTLEQLPGTLAGIRDQSEFSNKVMCVNAPLTGGAAEA